MIEQTAQSRASPIASWRRRAIHKSGHAKVSASALRASQRSCSNQARQGLEVRAWDVWT